MSTLALLLILAYLVGSVIVALIVGAVMAMVQLDSDPEPGAHDDPWEGL